MGGAVTEVMVGERCSGWPSLGPGGRTPQMKTCTVPDRHLRSLATRLLGAAMVLSTVLVVVSASQVDAATVSKTDLEAQVVALTNEHRAKVGCGPVRAENRLNTVARAHSDDMAAQDYFDHTSPAGLDPFDRIDGSGYRYTTASENLAAGLWRPEEVVQQWLDSPPHRENLENCQFTEIGVGVAGNAGSTYRYYWTQVFATPTVGNAVAEAQPEIFAGSARRAPWRCSGSSYC